MWRDDDIYGNQSYKFSVTPDYFRSVAQPSGSGMHFGRDEIRQILISVAVLTFAFALVLIGGVHYIVTEPNAFVIMLGAALLAVVTGFLFHELAHKRLAQSYGCFAEYRMSLWGLFLALITSLIGFLFALPGAVVISGRITVEQNGKISLAGPVLNMTVGAICFALVSLVSWPAIVSLTLYVIAYVNLWLGLFNLLPIYPLDGSKVLFWNKPIYFASIIISILLFGSFYLIA
ncbi:MAG: site-2 protease family protein [Thermoplasmata archaeon]